MAELLTSLFYNVLAKTILNFYSMKMEYLHCCITSSGFFLWNKNNFEFYFFFKKWDENVIHFCWKYALHWGKKYHRNFLAQIPEFPICFYCSNSPVVLIDVLLIDCVLSFFWLLLILTFLVHNSCSQKSEHA